MTDEGKRIHDFPADQDIQSHQVGAPEALEFVVHGSIATGYGLQLVEEVKNQFRERDFIGDHDARLGEVLQFFRIPLVAELQTPITLFRGTNHAPSEQALPGGPSLNRSAFYPCPYDHLIVRVRVVDHGGRRSDQVQIVFALQSLLDDFHVQKSQEPTSKTETQSG